MKDTFNGTVEVLGFPSNIFGHQEPGSNATEIMNGIRYVRPGNNFEPNFPLFKKIEVNGKNEHPLFTFLKGSCPPTRDYFAPAERLFYSPMKNNDIRWNFEKFLVAPDGSPIKRYDPRTTVKEVTRDLKSILNWQ